MSRIADINISGITPSPNEELVLKPANSAARNTMTPMERQCYDWGWEDGGLQVIKLIETYQGKPDFTLDNLKSLIRGDKK
jgi:hypothetical protein